MQIQLRFEGQIEFGAKPEVGEGPTRTINALFTGVCRFYRTQSWIGCMCALLASLAYARVHTSCSVSAHVNFITSCIVCAFWKCFFGAAGELIGVWRYWIPATICRKNFSDNRCPLMCEVRSIRIAKIHQCFFY
jgi:hypothetical protein